MHRIFWASILTSSLALAGNLKAPIDLQSAKVLPKGIRNIRYKGVLFQANEKYNNNGEQVIIAEPLYKKVTWKDITDPKVQTVKKGLMQGFINLQNKNQPNRYDMSKAIGETTGDIHVSGIAHVPVFAYGFTKKLTAALAVPYVKYQITVDTGFKADQEEMKKLHQDLASVEKTPLQQEFQTKLQDAIRTSVRDYGYNDPQNEEGKKLGDIKAVIKYQLQNTEKYALTLQNDYTLPTGKEADVNKLVDVPSGDGQTDIGLGAIADWYPAQGLTLSGFVGYTHQLAHKTAKRIPHRPDSKATSDIDSRTRVKLGDIINTQVGGKYEFLEGFNFNTSYNFKYKNRDDYSGENFDSARYTWATADSYQRMHAVRVGTGFSTIPLFKKKAFPVPLQANLSQTWIVGGKNVTKDPVTSFEFVMFF